MSEVLKNQHQELTFGVRSCVYMWKSCDSNVYSLAQRIPHRPPKEFKHLNPPLIQNSRFKPLLICCSKPSTILCGRLIMGEQRLGLSLHNKEHFMRTQDSKILEKGFKRVFGSQSKSVWLLGYIFHKLVSLFTRFENTVIDFVSCFWYLHKYWSSFSKS